MFRDAARYRQRLVDDPLKIVDGRLQWSPIAFAPHLVKRLDLQLCEADYRGVFAGVDVSSDLRGLVNQLKFIADGDSGSSIKSGNSPALQQAIQSFASRPTNSNLTDALAAAAKDKKVEKRLTDLVGYWNLYMTTAYQLPFFVQWHDDMSSISEGPHSSFANVSALIVELKTLRLRLESDLRSSGNDDIESTARSVQRLRERIEDNIREVCTSQTSVSPQIEAAVRTPIPTQDDRAAASERLMQLSDVEPANGPFSPAALGGMTWQWDRAFDRMRLHAQMIGMVNCPGISKMEIAAFNVKRPMSEPVARQLMRENGAGLLKLYQQLSTATFPDGNDLDHFLAMTFALPTNSSARDGEFIIPPVKFPTFTPDNQLTVVWNQPAIDLTLDEQSTAVVVAKMTKPETDSIRVNFNVSPPRPDADIIYVSPTQGEIPLNPGEDYAQPIGPDGMSRYELRIKPKQFADTALGDSPTVSITAKVSGWRSSPGDTLKATLTAQMPTRNIVDLKVEPISKFPEGVVSNKYTLRAYPNRPTTHRISLLNETGVDRAVRVIMYQVNRPRNANWPDGLLFADDPFTNRQPRLFPGLKETLEQITATGLVVAKSFDSIALPAGSEKRVMFEALADDADKSQDVRSIRDISDGILVKVIDLKKQGDKFIPTSDAWYHWLELLPIPPSVIFDCDAQWTAYDSTVRVSVNPKNDLPGEWKKSVMMRVRITPGKNANDSLEYSDFPIGGQALSFSDLPEMETRSIYVDVDGYPRAFTLKLPCPEKDDRDATPLEKRYSVRFEQIRAKDGSREFTRVGQETDMFRLQLFVDGKPEGPIKRQFPKPFFHGRTVKTLESRLAVDVPGGFTDRRASNTVQVRVDDTVIKTFSRDRDVGYSVSAVGDGSFTVKSEIRDHIFQFPQSLPTGGEMNISATIDDQGQVAGEDQVSVIIDESPPEIELQILGKSTIYETESCTVEVVYRGEDSPLRMLEFGIDRDGNEKLSKPEIVETYKNWPTRFQHRFFGLKPGDYTLIARVTDGVDQNSDDAEGTLSTALLTVRPKPRKKKK